MISANYFDGLSARLHPVNLELGHGTIGLAGADLVKSYPHAEVRFGEPFAQAAAVLDFADGARCEIPDPASQAAIAAALGYRKSRVVRWQDKWVGALAALVLLAVTVFAGVKWGIPALAERVEEGDRMSGSEPDGERVVRTDELGGFGWRIDPSYGHGGLLSTGVSGQSTLPSGAPSWMEQSRPAIPA